MRSETFRVCNLQPLGRPAILCYFGRILYSLGARKFPSNPSILFWPLFVRLRRKERIMKAASNVVVGLALLIALFASHGSAQEFTLTTTPANTVSSKSSIDMPGLTGNPLAIIVATPIGDTELLNPHPIGAWYYSGKWNIFNSDHAVMPIGSKYKVKFFQRPGPNQFLHLVTKENSGAEGSYIDNPALNNNPGARLLILQNHAPDVRTPYNLNRFKSKAEYSTAAGRWYIANVGGEPLYPNTVFNIVIDSGVGTATPPTVPQNPTPIGQNVPPRTPGDVVPPSQPGTPPVGQPPVGQPPVGQPPAGNPSATHDWILREDFQPTIAPNSEILLFIHGMDSRAEEADDITKALFAFMATRTAPSGPPVSGPSPNSGMIAVLQQLLQKYKSCILERYETQQDMLNRGLAANLSGLSNTNGLFDRDGVACVAGNTCTRLSRLNGFATLQAQASRGDATNFQTLLEQTIPKDCFQCQKHQEMHTKHVHCTMEAGGNSGFQGPYFEGCKAGMDLEALASTVISDIRRVIGAVPATQATGGPSIATNYSMVNFTSCPDPSKGCPEPCSFPDDVSGGQRTGILPADPTGPLYFAPSIPLAMLDTLPLSNQQMNVPASRNIGQNEGRLRPDLRKAAADANPLQSLRQAAYQFADGNTDLGKAFADLSVTGHRAFDAFRTALPKEPFCQSVVGQRPAQLSETSVIDGCRTALDRAYRVANYLRTGQRGDTAPEKTRKTNERLALGWIAVSGEDDSPHRPVNVPSSDYPQYDFEVVVETPLAATGPKTVSVRTRYVIAQSQANGKNLVMISLDLPTSGYSENLDFERVSPLAAIGNPKWTPLPVPIIVPFEITFLIPGMPPILPPGFLIPAGTPLPDFHSTGKTPLLDFLETFIVRFAEKLDQKVPVKNNFKAVMGGSLGGNMTFRLGRRANVPWLPKFIVWSPASIWTSLGEGADIFKHIGPRSAWESANAARNSPRDNDRALFFAGWDKPIVPMLIPMAQSDTWTSDYYPCKKSVVAAARLDRQETYDPRFLAWRWRLGAEQLLYSHQTIEAATNRPRYMSNLKPMLLACGTEDRVKFNDICPATQSTAPLMTMTPGKALFLDKTGHSLDNERRTYFAEEIVKFLGL